MNEPAKFAPSRPLNTPILFLIFNRLEPTKRVFEAIREAKPPRLYVGADGARSDKEGENEKVTAVRKFVMENIDWECEVKTLFRDQNLGCKYAVSEAITWFFENEDQGIILEDDCMPAQSFFYYCEDLLDRYREDNRIWHISGDNFQNGVKRGEASYYFSKYSHVWGWASWSSRWQHYDVELSAFSRAECRKKFKTFFRNKKEEKYWVRIFQDVALGKVDTWDYQWQFATWFNNGLAVLPNVNLVSNIGFGSDATHTLSVESEHSNLPAVNLSLPLRHLSSVEMDEQADAVTANAMFSNITIFQKVLLKIAAKF